MGRGARSGRRSRPILRRASSATTVRSLSTKPACAGSWRCCRRARELEAHGVVPEGPVGQARPAERVLAFFDPLFRGTTAVLELDHAPGRPAQVGRSEEHTSELQSLMRISYAVFCLKQKTEKQQLPRINHH